jgi:hypothetical protein
MVVRAKRSVLLARIGFFLFWVSELVKSSQIQYNSIYVRDESDAERGFHNKLESRYVRDESDAERGFHNKLESESFENLFQKGNFITKLL